LSSAATVSASKIVTRNGTERVRQLEVGIGNGGGILGHVMERSLQSLFSAISNLAVHAHVPCILHAQFTKLRASSPLILGCKFSKLENYRQ
jgi:hypothetical protein